MEGVAVLFLLGGILLGRWWWIATPLALTLPIVTWLALYEVTDGALYGDGPIDGTTFWILAAAVSAAAALAGIGLHQAAILLARRGKTRSGS